MSNTLKIAAVTASLLFIGVGAYASVYARKARKGNQGAVGAVLQGLGNVINDAMGGTVPGAGDPASFVRFATPYAKQAEKKTGIPFEFAIAQSALETGWGKKVKGNAFFGIKATGPSYGGWDGNTTCFSTREEFSLNDWHGWAKAHYEKMGPVQILGKTANSIEVQVKDCFRAYGSPFDSFLDWGGMLASNSRYANAMRVRYDPYAFADAIARAGYATASNYASALKSVITTVNSKLAA